jgi:hypothetical protein
VAFVKLHHYLHALLPHVAGEMTGTVLEHCAEIKNHLVIYSKIRVCLGGSRQLLPGINDGQPKCGGEEAGSGSLSLVNINTKASLRSKSAYSCQSLLFGKWI